MSFAIIRGGNGRRHEVDFGDDPVTLDVSTSEAMVQITIEAAVLSIRGRADVLVPEGLAPLYLEYEPGDYERVFALSDAVDPAGIEARVRGGVLHLRLPKAGPAELRRIEVRAD